MTFSIAYCYLSRKSPKQRIYRVDQYESFEDGHVIKLFNLFELTIWLLEQVNKCMGMFCNIVWNKKTGFLSVQEVIKVI